MKKKIIKLINNERINKRLLSAKSCEGDSTATDFCEFADNAQCTVYAYDNCGKDYAACYNGANDNCSQVDETVCKGSSGMDYETEPYPN